MSEIIEKCPRCKTTPVFVPSIALGADGAPRWRLWCPYCGAHIDNFGTESEALSVWNSYAVDIEALIKIIYELKKAL